MTSPLNIFVAGHNGMVGGAIHQLLLKKGYRTISKSRTELDLTDSKAVLHLFENEQIDMVINAAAKVGGILANDLYPYDFLMQNFKNSK